MRTSTSILVFASWLSLVKIEACQVTQLGCRIDLFCTNEISFQVENNGYACEQTRRQEYNDYYDNNYDEYSGYSYYLSYKGPSFTLSNVYPDRLSNIYGLNLNDNMYDTIPDIIHTMKNLKYLTLNGNKLTQAKLSSINGLNSLEKLDLSNNIIDSISVNPNQLAFNQLKFLNISFNYITNLPQDTFALLPELINLDLSYNEIDSLNFMSFNHIKHIKYLNLSHNKISDLNMSLLIVGDLEELDLSFNELNNINAHEFKMMANLILLDLSHNLIVSIEQNALQIMHSLSRLDISHNNIEVLDQYLFKNLSLLQRVDFSKNHIAELPQNMFKDNSISFISLKGNNFKGSILKYTFQGLSLITELDLSFYGLTTLDDYAFIGLDILHTLLLNNNALENLSPKCFSSLNDLNRLDLSNNKLLNIKFETTPFTNLYSLDLSNNCITHITPSDFRSLVSLEYLNLSNNSISNFKSYSFENLNKLVNLNISSNPINGSLHKNMFVGLSSLPSLDISHNMLIIIENGSVSGMTLLNDLKLSYYGNINEIQYNAFIDIYNITTLNLSYNKIEVFVVNNTSLEKVQELLLHNNFIRVLTFEGMHGLKKVILSYNKLQNISINAFKDQIYLQHLDLSHNGNLTLDFPIIQNLNNINKLFLSGIINKLVFTNFINNSIEQLDLSHSNITNVTRMDFKHLSVLKTLDMSKNTIKTIKSGDFIGLKQIKDLILSHNKIEFIQPGSFINNSLMFTLDVSYNNLKTINYGVFIGLNHLKFINLSYNQINTLKNEHFFQVHDLQSLIVDHNEIENVSLEDFTGTKLKILSIGDNPIPCDVLIRIKKQTHRGINVTAIKFDYNTENVDGITCNRNWLDKSNFEIANTAKLQKSIESNQTFPKTQTHEPIKLKHDLDDSLNKINGKIHQLEAEIQNLNFRFNNNITESFAVKTLQTRNEKLVSGTENASRSSPSSLIFTETCVALILAILVCFILYTFYNSKLFMTSDRTLSRRAIVAMESSNL